MTVTLTVDVEQEVHGRWIATAQDVPGRAHAPALRALAPHPEHGEERE